MSDCGSTYLLKVQLAQSNSAESDAFGASFYNVAKSKSPPSGFYWRVLQVDAIDTNPNAQALEFVLIPANKVPLTSELPISIPVKELFKRFLSSIRICAGHSEANLSDLTLLKSIDGSFAAPIQMDPIIVPPGWCIAAFELTASAINHRVTLRLWFVEVPIGTEIPF